MHPQETLRKRADNQSKLGPGKEQVFIRNFDKPQKTPIFAKFQDLTGLQNSMGALKQPKIANFKKAPSSGRKSKQKGKMPSGPLQRHLLSELYNYMVVQTSGHGKVEN